MLVRTDPTRQIPLGHLRESTAAVRRRSAEVRAVDEGRRADLSFFANNAHRDFAVRPIDRLELCGLHGSQTSLPGAACRQHTLSGRV